MTKRGKALFMCALAVLLLLTVLGMFFADAADETDFARKNLAPCFEYPFGTDWMGRDMFTRALAGLSLSIRIGLATVSASALAAAALGTAAAMSRKLDPAISWFTDLVMGVPHILLLVLVSFACGRGFTGVVAAVALSHWMSLARLIRSEILQLKESVYVRAAEKLGHSRAVIARRHMAPHLLPQFSAGVALLFPHAILHEASITFLGFGLPPEAASIGIILSESMRYLMMGRWWLAVFPGLLLVGSLLLFMLAGSCLREMTGPAGQEGEAA